MLQSMPLLMRNGLIWGRQIPSFFNAATNIIGIVTRASLLGDGANALSVKSSRASYALAEDKGAEVYSSQFCVASLQHNVSS